MDGESEIVGLRPGDHANIRKLGDDLLLNDAQTGHWQDRTLADRSRGAGSRMAAATIAATMLIAMTGCSPWAGTPSSAYQHYGDRLKSRFGGFFGIPCWKDGKQSVPNSQCYQFGPSKQFSGILIVDNSVRSQFLPNTHYPPLSSWQFDHWTVVTDRRDIEKRLSPTAGWKFDHWIVVADRRVIDKRLSPAAGKIWFADPKAYLIQFTGRATAEFPKRQYQNERGMVLVERIESMRQIAWNPKD